MRFTLDTDFIEGQGMDLPLVLFLLSLYFESPGIYTLLKEAHEKSLIFVDEYTDGLPTKYHLTPNAIEDIEKLIMAKTRVETTPAEKDRFILLAEAMRELFPKGKKPGTNLQWRDSAIMIATRLKTLVCKYNIEFTDEEAIKATKAYVDSFFGDYKYMQVLKYFIIKNTNVGGEIEKNSQFMSYLSNIKEGNPEGEEEYREDWTSTLV